MMLWDRYLVFGDLAESFNEVDDGVAVQVPRSGEYTINRHDDALRAEQKQVDHFGGAAVLISIPSAVETFFGGHFRLELLCCH